MTPVKLSISIMMHPDRTCFLPYLKGKLGDVPVRIDTKLEGTWSTCRAAWLAHDPTAEYHVVLQDDAIIGREFLQRAPAAINDKRLAYSFYFGRRQRYMPIIDQRMKDGCTDITIHNLHFGLAVCLPVRCIYEMIGYGDSRTDLPPHLDDARIKQFLWHKGMTVRYPLPSLVDHRPGWSVIHNRMDTGRRAQYFIGE